MTSSPHSPTPPKNLAELVQDEPVIPFAQAFPSATLLKVGVLAALLAALQYRFVEPMVAAWRSDPNWSHGFIIPLFSLYLLFSRRDELKRVKRHVCLAGLALVILGLVGEFSSLYVLKNFWGSQLSMLLVLFGLVLYLAGPSVIRITWLPIVYLVFAIPLPEMLYNRIALPMQNLAAQGSMLMLRAAGVNITSDASALHLISRSGLPQELTVAEACSGMHLLMAFMALGVAMAYLDNKPLWQRLILVCAGVPIAIFCNVLRVAITAWMFYIDKAEMGTGFMHAFTGIVMLIPALVMLWLLARILKMMIIEVDEEPQSEATQAKG